MYLLLIFLPFFAFFLLFFFGKMLGKIGTFYILSSLYISILFIIIIIFIEVCLFHSFCFVQLPLMWIRIELLTINWSFIFDTISVAMLLVVCLISTLVHFYSTEYMLEDPAFIKFLSYISLFTFFMIILLTSGNFLQLFLGWEGVGLSSYLLINFWTQRIFANKSAFKAMIVNRIGDWGLALGICLIFFICRTLDFSMVFLLSPFVQNTWIFFFNNNLLFHELCCCFLFLGVMGKSAQFGLHTWLPDAMEGPTPVSALIHAATMVTAGVFLLVRCSPLFEYATLCLCFISFLGGLTALFGATIACFQEDLKKIIAYSTCSQLGYMVLACGLSLYSTGLFHFFNHAFFKALLFLSAGAVIHCLLGEQNNDNFTELDISFNFFEQMFFIGSGALSSVCFLSGFYSKDWLLEIVNAYFFIDSIVLMFLAFMAAIYTGFYTGLSFVGFREEDEEEELSLNFFNFNQNNFHLTSKLSLSIYSSIEERYGPIVIVLSLLACLSIFMGFIFYDFFIGIGTSAWEGSIFILPEHFMFFEIEFLPFYWKLAPIALGVAITFPTLRCFTSYKFLEDFFLSWEDFFTISWAFDELFNYFSIKFLYNYVYTIFFVLIDRSFLELCGPYGIITSLTKAFSLTSKFQKGLLYYYSFMIVLNIIIFFFITFLSTFIIIDVLFIYIYIFCIFLFLSI